MLLKQRLERLREYDEIADFGAIARRYFAMNAFDGVITIIGVVVGSMVAGVEDPRIVIVTGITTCVAIGISGFWGAYLTESAERKRTLRQLERHTLSSLEGSRVGRAQRTAIIVVTLVDGLSPPLVGALVIAPFFVAAQLPSIAWAYIGSLALALVTLFALGMFLGRISKQSMVRYGLKTTLAGAAAIIAGLLLSE